ncbi:MAG: HAMP domain-containing protein, partial [Hyphomicrobiales bacterium]|nr:HAMP domain-containing protein [Hyphomicrobiales bacterium]
MSDIALAPRQTGASREREPSTRRRFPLTLKLAAALVGLVVLVLLVNGAINMWLSYGEAKSAALGVQQEKAQAAAQRVGEFVGEIENQIGWTTRLEWSRVPLEQQRYDFTRLLRQVPALTEVSYLDGSGKEQLKVSRLEPDVIASGRDFSSEPRFTTAVADKIWFGSVYFRRGSEPYMTVAVAHAGHNSGVTVAEVNLKLIWDVITSIRVGQKGYAYVVDEKGRLVAHPDLSLVLRDTDFSQLPQVRQSLHRPSSAASELPATSTTPAENAEIATAYEGGSVLTAQAEVPRLNWHVFVQLPVAEALAPVYASLIQTIALLGLGLLLALVAGSYLARRLVVPIRHLQEGAERIGGGDLTQRIEIKTGDEIETLADRFNQMAGRVRESYETLEAKVETRTKDLNEA